jgi:hypothetical protein
MSICNTSPPPPQKTKHTGTPTLPPTRHGIAVVRALTSPRAQVQCCQCCCLCNAAGATGALRLDGSRCGCKVLGGREVPQSPPGHGIRLQQLHGMTRAVHIEGMGKVTWYMYVASACDTRASNWAGHTIHLLSTTGTTGGEGGWGQSGACCRLACTSLRLQSDDAELRGGPDVDASCHTPAANDVGTMYAGGEVRLPKCSGSQHLVALCHL